MSTASLELCKELHELSGWDDECLAHKSGTIGNPKKFFDDDYFWSIPLYDLGYLLRNLRDVTLTNDVRDGEEAWRCGVFDFFDSSWVYDARAETPEDAAAKLAIELFKQGTLRKEVA